MSSKKIVYKSEVSTDGIVPEVSTAVVGTTSVVDTAVSQQQKEIEEEVEVAADKESAADNVDEVEVFQTNECAAEVEQYGDGDNTESSVGQSIEEVAEQDNDASVPEDELGREDKSSVEPEEDREGDEAVEGQDESAVESEEDGVGDQPVEGEQPKYNFLTFDAGSKGYKMATFPRSKVEGVKFLMELQTQFKTALKDTELKATIYEDAFNNKFK